MFITSATTGITEVHSRTKLYTQHVAYKGTEVWLISSRATVLQIHNSILVVISRGHIIQWSY